MSECKDDDDDEPKSVSRSLTDFESQLLLEYQQKVQKEYDIRKEMG